MLSASAPPATLPSCATTALTEKPGSRDIIAWHNIPSQVDATTTAKDVAKALPIRLLHGGTYAKWVKDFGLRDAGVSNGAGYPAVTLLQEQLKGAHAATTAPARRSTITELKDARLS